MKIRVARTQNHRSSQEICGFNHSAKGLRCTAVNLEFFFKVNRGKNLGDSRGEIFTAGDEFLILVV